MPSATAQTELAEFLRAIERGSVSLTPEQEPQDVYAGNVSYAASNGWRVVVFNDANEWDYIFSIATSDGRVFDHEALNGMPGIGAYEPSAEVAWTRYGIPGYSLFRCTSCGTRLKKEKGHTMFSPFLCAACQTR
jgi:hypothetical protein